jgi:hypothetical protein
LAYGEVDIVVPERAAKNGRRVEGDRWAARMVSRAGALRDAMASVRARREERRRNRGDLRRVLFVCRVRGSRGIGGACVTPLC